MTVRIILATRNDHKVAEIQSLLTGKGILVSGLSGYPDLPEVEETGATLEENALLKARAAYRATGIPAVSDDTGLEVDFLQGEPGVRSARYAGDNVSYDQNNEKLLRELSAAPPGGRSARFRCVAAFVDGDMEACFAGVCEGTILVSSRGANGFGYDPVFLPAGSTRTFAEMTPAEKNRISHRSSAFRQMDAFLGRRYAAPRT